MTTTSRPSEPDQSEVETAATATAGVISDARQPIHGAMRGLLVMFIPANLALFMVYGAVPGVLLPTQVAALDPANKVANLAIVTTIGALAAMIAQPVAGAISDRTRSRFGRRAQWIVAGALIGGLGLVGLAFANGLVQITIAWAIAQIAYNFAQGPLSAIVPDRVPKWALGTFAAIGGMASMLGAVGGQVAGAAFAKSLGTGYLFLAGLGVILLTVFVVFNRDTSSTDAERIPFRLADFLRTFWVNPLTHPDFFWAFAGRLLLYTGFFSVFGYNLYLLQSYIGLGDKAVGYVPLLGLLSLAGMVPAIVIGGLLSDRLGRRKIFVFLSSVIVGLGLIVPIFDPTLPGMMIETVICGIGFGAFQSVDQAVMNQVLPNVSTFAKDLGVVNIAATLPQVLAPAVGGGIVILFGYVGIFPVAIGLSVLGAFAVLFIKAVK
jgi:MFS family permease